MRDPLQELEGLRRRRSWAEPDLSITSVVRRTAESLQRAQRGLGELLELWHDLIPPHLVSRCALVRLRSGVLEVHADSASVRYELDRLLRAGALRQMQRAYRGTLVRVRVRPGDTDRSGHERQQPS